MKILGTEILSENWNTTISEVDVKLKQFKDFTSPTYQVKDLQSINHNFILVKPKQEHFCAVLNFEWKYLEILEIEDV